MSESFTRRFLIGFSGSDFYELQLPVEDLNDTQLRPPDASDLYCGYYRERLADEFRLPTRMLEIFRSRITLPSSEDGSDKSGLDDDSESEAEKKPHLPLEDDHPLELFQKDNAEPPYRAVLRRVPFTKTLNSDPAVVFSSSYLSEAWLFQREYLAKDNPGLTLRALLHFFEDGDRGRACQTRAWRTVAGHWLTSLRKYGLLLDDESLIDFGTGLDGLVFAQGQGLQRVGVASYHFPPNEEPYLDYSAANEGPNAWLMDDDLPPPENKRFTWWKFDAEERLFSGRITWWTADVDTPTSFSSSGSESMRSACSEASGDADESSASSFQTPRSSPDRNATFGGAATWDYEMRFAVDYSFITMGTVKSRGKRKSLGEPSKFGQELFYSLVMSRVLQDRVRGAGRAEVFHVAIEGMEEDPPVERIEEGD